MGRGKNGGQALELSLGALRVSSVSDAFYEAVMTKKVANGQFADPEGEGEGEETAKATTGTVIPFLAAAAAAARTNAPWRDWSRRYESRTPVSSSASSMTKHDTWPSAACRQNHAWHTANISGVSTRAPTCHTLH